MFYSPLAKEDLERLHQATLTLLMRTGIQIEDEWTLKFLEKNGIKIDFKRNRAFFSENLVKEALMKSPRTIKIYAREKKFNLCFGSNQTYGHTPEGAFYVIKNNELINATLNHLKEMAILVDALDGISFFIPNIIPNDVNPNIGPIYMFKTSLENTTKVIGPFGHEVKHAKYIVKIGSVVRGGLEELIKKPLFFGMVVPTDPLIYSKNSLENLQYYAKLGLPIFFCSMPLSGGTAPVTLAGTIVIQNAVLLAGIVIAQLISPGIGCVYAPRATILDQKSGLAAAGAPEMGLMGAVLTQLARELYSLPVDAGWAVSDSIYPDIQVGYEKMSTILLCMLAGANSISGLGGLGSGKIASHAQLIIDNEAFKMALRIKNSLKIDENRLALKIIDDVGPGGHFLSRKHTLTYIKEEHFIPELFFREGIEKWTREKKTLLALAQKRAVEILNTHKPEPLSTDCMRELEKIIKEAEKNLASKV
ncbi:MAG: trimethylamine methyltransferase family protein [Candidatus Methanomethylicaceae archaeon]